MNINRTLGNRVHGKSFVPQALHLQASLFFPVQKSCLGHCDNHPHKFLKMSCRGRYVLTQNQQPQSAFYRHRGREVKIFTQSFIVYQWQAGLEKEKEQWRKKEIAMLMLMCITVRHCARYFLLCPCRVSPNPSIGLIGQCIITPIFFQIKTQHFRQVRSLTPNGVRAPFW